MQVERTTEASIVEGGSLRCTNPPHLAANHETFCLVLENDLGVLRAMLHRNKVLLAKAGVMLMLCVMIFGTAATMILIRPLKSLQTQAREDP